LMTPFLKNEATILLQPDPGWNWVGWDGRLTIFSQTKPLQLSGGNIIIESDVPLFTLTTPRQYMAVGFSDPGTILPSLFTVDKPTLANKIKINGEFYPLLKTTTGKFTCEFVMPATQPVPPVPDPVNVKTGTWTVVESNQQVFFKDYSGLINELNSPCIPQAVPDMSHGEKMWGAIKMAWPNIGHAIGEEFGSLKDIATGLGVVGAVLGGAALAGLFFGIGAVVAVVAVGEVLADIGVVVTAVQVAKGIGHLTDFVEKTGNANNCADLENAAKSFEHSAGELTVAGATAALSYGMGKLASRISSAVKEEQSVSAGVAAEKVTVASQEPNLSVVNNPTKGFIDQSQKVFNKAESKIAEKLVSEGKNVIAQKESNVKGVRSADALVDGVETEFKTVGADKPSDITIKRSIDDSTKNGGQGKAVVIDARESALTKTDAEKGMERAKGAYLAKFKKNPEYDGKLENVRIIGEGFDISKTFKPEP